MGSATDAAQGELPVRWPFIACYAFALLGAWMAIMTPATVTLALRVAQIDPLGKERNYSLVAGVGALFALCANPLFGALSDTLQGVARLDYSYVDHSYSATITAGSPRLRQSYELLNLRAGIVKGPWETVVFINNVTDTRQNLGDYLSLDGEAPSRPRWLTGPPRTVGIDLRMHF